MSLSACDVSRVSPRTGGFVSFPSVHPNQHDPTATAPASTRPGVARTWSRIWLNGVAFDAASQAQAVGYVMAALRAGVGGRIVTPNVDIMRQVSADSDLASLVSRCDLVVADGMPLIWASRLAGRPLPGRVPGSDLIWSLAAGAAEHGHRIYLLGGEPGVPERAAGMLAQRSPGLRVAGTDSPPFGFDLDPPALESVLDRVATARPDVVFVGLGFPKQERLIDRLATRLPSAWFLGCGASIAFVAGALRRAPGWMQRSGLEWAHRLGAEPARLIRRYLVHDAPYAVRLLATAAGRRGRPSTGSPTPADQPSAPTGAATMPPSQRSGSLD